MQRSALIDVIGYYENAVRCCRNRKVPFRVRQVFGHKPV